MLNTVQISGKHLPILFTLCLGACSTHTALNTPVTPSDDAAPLASDAVIAEEFNSVTQARENAIQQTDELVLLEENLQTAIDNSFTLPEEFWTDVPLPPADDELSLVTDNEITNSVIEASPDVELTATDESDIANDLWPRIRDGFRLSNLDHPRVNNDRQWYTRNQGYLDRTFGRAEPYLYYIVEQIEARDMPLELALLPVVESAFQPFAYSHGRAAGLWQFIPGTARHYGLKINWWYDGRRDVKAATTAALDYLDTLHRRFDNDWLLALAAYNSGEGTVASAIRKNKRLGKGTSFWDLKLPRETESYVPKLLAISSIVADPEQHGVTLPLISDRPYLTEVDTGSQLDLAIAADLAEMSMEALYRLNPAFNRWATAPDGPHHLLLPIDKGDAFREKLAALPEEQRVKWLRHRIKSGETLGQIARHYNTTIKTIQTANKIRGNIIRAGHYLIIPAASQSANSYALSEEQRRKNTQNTARSGTKTNYTVRPGDTLWDISMAHKVSVGKLATWNSMAPRDTLRPGQTLVIWTKSDASGEHSNTPTGNPFVNATTRKINYRVRNGDSLARISQRFNVSIRKLKQWNPRATKGKYIQPGQRLVVYVDVTRVSENI